MMYNVTVRRTRHLTFTVTFQLDDDECQNDERDDSIVTSSHKMSNNVMLVIQNDMGYND